MNLIFLFSCETIGLKIQSNGNTINENFMQQIALTNLVKVNDKNINRTDTRNVLDCDQSNYFSRIIFSYIFTPEPKWKGRLVAEMAGRHLVLGATENSSIDLPSAVLENPTLKQNMKWIGWPVLRSWETQHRQSSPSGTPKIRVE